MIKVKLYFFIILIPGLALSSIEGEMDFLYKIVSTDGSKALFKNINLEESGFEIDNLNLKFSNEKNKFFAVGNGIGSSSPERFFYLKGKIEDKFKFWANYNEKIYYFNNFSSEQVHNEKYYLKRLDFFTEYEFSQNFSVFLNNGNFKNRQTINKEYFLLGSLIGQKKDLNSDEREISLGTRLNKNPFFLEFSQSIAFVDRDVDFTYSDRIDSLSYPYLSSPEGEGKENYDFSYPRSNLVFNFIKDNFKIFSNLNYSKGEFEGRGRDGIYFNFGENGNLISSLNFDSNFKNKFENLSSYFDFSYRIFSFLEFENRTDFEKEKIESEIFEDTLLVFKDPESGFTLELPYELQDSKEISVKRIFNESTLILNPFSDLDFFFSYNFNKREINEERDLIQKEKTLQFGFKYLKSFLEIEGNYRKGEFDRTDFRTEPLYFDGYSGKINLRSFKNISLLLLAKDYNSKAEEGKYENKSFGYGFCFFKGNYIFNLLFLRDKVSSDFPVDFGFESVSHYEYEGKNYSINFSIPLKDLKIEGYYSKIIDEGEIYPFRFINSYFKVLSNEIGKNLTPFFEVKYLSYENNKYILKTKGMVYIFGLNLKVER